MKVLSFKSRSQFRRILKKLRRESSKDILAGSISRLRFNKELYKSILIYYNGLDPVKTFFDTEIIEDYSYYIILFDSSIVNPKYSNLSFV